MRILLIATFKNMESKITYFYFIPNCFFMYIKSEHFRMENNFNNLNSVGKYSDRFFGNVRNFPFLKFTAQNISVKN